jgi:4-hydroxymandelate oxidase
MLFSSMSQSLTRRRALESFGAFLAASPLLQAPLLQAQEAPKLIGEPPGRIAPRQELVNVLEMEAMAERSLPQSAYLAIAGGDRAPFERIIFRPRMLVNTQQLDLSLDLFGQRHFAPILVGPVSGQGRFHPEGEIAGARGAAAAKAGFIASSQSTQPIEKIAAEAKAGCWYQVYPEPDMAALAARAQAAVKAGCKGVFLTVGTPYRPVGEGAPPNPVKLAQMGNPALDWNAVDLFRKTVGAPLILKGIMSPEEARTAVERGVQGIVVSNHGGQFASGLAAPMDVLPAIADAVGGKIPVLIDGGFRRGSDVLKGLAQGATAVVVARPPMWGLAAYGADGVQTVMELLQTELARSMAMCGKATLKSIDRNVIKVVRR